MCYCNYRRGLQSPVRGLSRGNTPDPAVHPEISPPPPSPPDKDDESPDDSKVRIFVCQCFVL